MKKISLTLGMVVFGLMVACQQPENKEEPSAQNEQKESWQLLGYESKAAYGEHLVLIGGCDDCHSPKVMGPQGPEVNKDLRLSGHPANEPAPDINRQEIESKFMAACNPGLTAWVGPWGVSFAANITSDATGIGNWSEEQFKRAMQEGKLKGMPEGRMLLPPMPWPALSHMTDDEISSIFEYLKSIPAINNVAPTPLPPLAAMAQ
ncbi:MAG TPA: c-type cytochrome [Bacteroidia bacterium]|nr:c-type cytochrome [Bacteroidia bacterium]HNT80441.1 c-type cytochrome [Bacteroidia bacterium]